MKRLAMICLLCFPFSAAIPLTTAILTVAQQQDPHEGQPDTCTNAKNAPKAHQCACKKDPGEDGAGCEIEDKACRVYCRKTQCYCAHKGCED